MGEHAIVCEGLGKRYPLGAVWPGGSLRDTLATRFRMLAGRSGDNRADVADRTVWALRDVSFEVNPARSSA